MANDCSPAYNPVMYDARLRENLPQVRDRIAHALEKSGRTGGVRIVAVTKGHSSMAASAALAAGLGDIGENRVQELEAKRGDISDAGVTWHLIGHLQRNKVRRALQLFDVIHSIDSLRLARELSNEAQIAGIDVRGLVQVNVSGETSKGGFDAARAADEVLAVASLPGVGIEGLMTMAPFTDDERVVRTTFAGARALLDECRAGLHGVELSMGMSSDYEIAIEEGSTMLRLGTALFGERLQ